MAGPSIVVIIAICLVNGLFSPALLLVILLSPVWFPEILPADRSVVFHTASLLVVAGTFVLGGVPAALFERLARAAPDDRRTRWIWTAACGLLTLPAVARFL